jgi:hypothetical protein
MIILVPLCLIVGAAAQTPKFGPTQTFKDWIVGCDNTMRCEAQSLVPDVGDFSGTYTIRVIREAGPRSSVEVWFPTDAKGPVDFFVDGQRIAGAPVVMENATVNGPEGLALVVAMARGATLEVKAGSETLGRPSLSGSAAAMRFIDSQQAREGTITALVATGTRGAKSVKPSPSPPVVPQIVPAPDTISLQTEERAAAIRFAGCMDLVDPSDKLDAFALSKTQVLVLVPCGSGAYNANTVVLIADSEQGTQTFAKAKFDSQPGPGVQGVEAMIVNGGWDPRTGHLMSYYKGRGLGDCGGSQDYVWDGTMFRLVEAKLMGECRGSTDWLTVWRATPKPALGPVRTVAPR